VLIHSYQPSNLFTIMASSRQTTDHNYTLYRFRLFVIISMLSVSRNTAPVPYIGLSAILSCRYVTFSNNQQVRQCQNDLTASHTMHLSLFNITADTEQIYLFWEPAQTEQSAGILYNCSSIYCSSHTVNRIFFKLPSSIPVFHIETCQF